MRILHINDIATVGSTIANAQKSILGHEVYFVNIIPQGQRSKVSKILTLYERIKLVWKARKLINKLNPDIVHLHYSTSAIWMLWVKPKLVVHAHGSDIRLNNNDYFRKAINFVGLKLSTVIICSTPDLLEYARKYHKSCFYLPNPIDTDIYDCRKVIARKFKFKKILVLAVPSRIKGFHTAANAVVNLLTNCPDLHFTIFKNEISTEFFQSHCFDNLHLIDMVHQSEVTNLICDHDIIVGQFKLGAFGMSELQAMSCGKPVICNGIHNQILINSPPHFQAESEAHIIHHINKLITSSDDVFKSISRKSRGFISANHSLQSVILKLEEIYKHD